MFIVCLPSCDLISMWVVVLVVGSTIEAPRVGLSVICETSVYMKSDGCHAAWKSLMGVLSECVEGWGMGGGDVYACRLSRCHGSLLVMSRGIVVRGTPKRSWMVFRRVDVTSE